MSKCEIIFQYRLFFMNDRLALCLSLSLCIAFLSPGMLSAQYATPIETQSAFRAQPFSRPVPGAETTSPAFPEPAREQQRTFGFYQEEPREQSTHATEASYATDQWLSPNSVETPFEPGVNLRPPVGAYMPPTRRVSGNGDEFFIEGESGSKYFSPTSGPSLIQKHKNGMFQKLTLSSGWIGGQGTSELGMTEVNTYATFALPMFGEGNILAITPKYSVTYFDGPFIVDIPAQGISAGVDLTWNGRLNERWGGTFGVSPTFNSDTHSTEDAIRYTGRILFTYDYRPETMKFLMGVVYVDRDDLNILPVAGLIWTPSHDVRIDLVVPRPKFAYRWSMVPGDHEDWVYFVGTFGGRTWAVERANGTNDRLTVADIRLMFGYERIKSGGAGWFFETGIVVDRRVEYASSATDLVMQEAFVFRGGLAF